MEKNNPKEKDMGVRQLQRHENVDFYPLTSVKTVIDDNGNSVDLILGESEQKMLEGYSYEGQAHPAKFKEGVVNEVIDEGTNPGTITPGAKVYYLAVEQGTYIHFDNLVIYKEGTFALKFNGSKWSLEELFLATTTNNVYDKATMSNVEDVLIDSESEGRSVNNIDDTLIKDALRKSQQNMTQTERNQVYRNLGLDAKFTSLESRITEGYKYIGMAVPNGTPSVVAGHVYYIAIEKGTYTNYGGKVVNDNGVHILKYNGSWGLETIINIKDEFGNDDKAVLSQKVITNNLLSQNFNSIAEVPVNQIINNSTAEKGIIVYNKLNNNFLYLANGKYYGKSNTEAIVGTNPISGKIYLLNGKPYFGYNGDLYDYNGDTIKTNKEGTTIQRPTNANDGFQYFDKDVNKFVWKHDNIWLDANGTLC